MKKLQAGLVIEGNSTASTLLRLPGFAAELGPIKSSGLQVARRVSNFLNTGYAVTSYADLATARTILIRVPDNSIERVTTEICNAQWHWSEHSFVLCETWAPTERLQRLRMLGANIASLVALPGIQEKIFAVEGDVAAVRQVRRIIERANARTIELRAGTKHLFFAATILCTAIPVPILLLAQQFLRDCGISGNQLSGAIEQMSQEMFAGFLKGARLTWGGELAESLKSLQGAHWNRLDDTHPQLARSLRDLVKWSDWYMGQKLSRTHEA